VIGIFGSLLQRGLAEQNLRRDYVQLALSLLTKDRDEVDAPLRAWAVQLLDDNAPTRFAPEVLAQLKSGDVGFPSALSRVLGASGNVGIAMGADGRTIAIGQHDGSIALADVTTGTVADTLRGHTRAIISLSFSPDGVRLLSGSMDGTVRIWDVTSRRELLRLRDHGGGVAGAAFSADGSQIISRDSDGLVYTWEARTGRPLTVRTAFIVAAPEG
jgi:WD40 repeat protein